MRLTHKGIREYIKQEQLSAKIAQEATRDKAIPLHRYLPNAPGRKVIQPVTESSALVYHCRPCDRKFNEAQAFSACPYCYRPLLAKVKE